VEAEKVPAGQGGHALAPALSPYDPAAQMVHTLAPDGEDNPEAQMVQARAPDKEYEPATQGVHVGVPLGRHAPYWPLAQGGHCRMIMGE